MSHFLSDVFLHGSNTTDLLKFLLGTTPRGELTDVFAFYFLQWATSMRSAGPDMVPPSKVNTAAARPQVRLSSPCSISSNFCLPRSKVGFLRACCTAACAAREADPAAFLAFEPPC